MSQQPKTNATAELQRPTAKPTRTDLSAMIEADLQTCDTLMQLFAAEQLAIGERHFDMLDEVIHQKNQCLQSLETHARQRSAWISPLPQGIDAKEQWLALLKKTDTTLIARWEQLQQRFANCQQQNEVSGKVLSRKNATYGKLVKILRGQSLGSGLYTAKGSANRPYSGHTLGEA